MPLKRIQKILPVALDDELARLGKAQTVMRRWDEVVGPVLANRSAPDRFDRGVLWVAVEGSAWAQELRLMKIKILSKLNDYSGDHSLFTNIRFGVRKLPEKEPVEDGAEEAPKPEEASDGSAIRSIAERRLKNWPDVKAN